MTDLTKPGIEPRLPAPIAMSLQLSYSAEKSNLSSITLQRVTIASHFFTGASS